MRSRASAARSATTATSIQSSCAADGPLEIVTRRVSKQLVDGAWDDDVVVEARRSSRLAPTAPVVDPFGRCPGDCPRSRPLGTLSRGLSLPLDRDGGMVKLSGARRVKQRPPRSCLPQARQVRRPSLPGCSSWAQPRVRSSRAPASRRDAACGFGPGASSRRAGCVFALARAAWRQALAASAVEPEAAQSAVQLEPVEPEPEPEPDQDAEERPALRPQPCSTRIGAYTLPARVKSR